MAKKKNRLDKAALVQRDYETYAIVPHIPGGICTPEVLRKIADVAEKYSAAAIKVTGAQRLAIVGLKEEDLDKAWQELGIKPGAAAGMCIRSIKFCPGTTFCRLGQQDAIGMGMKLDEIYHGYRLPSKLKIGVSGCPNCCAESWVKDIGLIGAKKGWKLVVGGSAGSRPTIAQVLAEGLTDDEALDLIKRVIDRFEIHTRPQRLGRLISEIGIDTLKKDIGVIE
ncbi:MAG: NAD(P)/FAD-dependent oxidoreductase [Nitrospiraceae bacterium]|nr:NAD(P)/FAD-dependent oxidoreductase [Nitrospiraceae bacterium]